MLTLTKRRAFRILGVQKTKTIHISMLVALVGVLGLTILLGSLVSPPRTAVAAPHAVGNEPWLEINCLETEVEEGDDFRLLVNKKFHSDWPHETIRVFWYTDSITADQSDYEHLYAERQSSNGSQSKHGRMGRNFHTLEDNFPEADETFKVRFNNSVDYGHDGECVITITDDDGVGIYDLEITSVPQELPASGNDQPQVGYAVEDVIEITAHFTGDVTTINPDTGQRADYAGIYLQVGENRRFAPALRGDSTDTLVFGYTVQADDADADGISVEGGGPSTGLGYNPNNRDGGIWITENGSSRINRLFHGLDDDPGHSVYQLKVDEPVTTPPTTDEIPVDPEPLPFGWMEDAIVIDDALFFIEHGELTDEDEGRDWFSFTATSGENYIIEAESRMDIQDDGDGTPYVENHLIDPSILEIVNKKGEQVLGEQDQGGFILNWARGYFNPEDTGTYYIAVGSGHQDPYGTGHYTVSVRVDDHPDDYKTRPDVVIRPGESITAKIDRDVSPDDPRLHPWDWRESHNTAVPLWGIESLDDHDAFRFEIGEEGTYRLSVSDAPENVGIWWILEGGGNALALVDDGPVESLTYEYQPGTYVVAVGTRYESEGNTGTYTLSLAEVDDAAMAVRP